MSDHNVEITLDTREPIDEQLLEQLAAYHPATGRDDVGRVLIILTLPAVDVAQAVQTGVAVVSRAHRAPALAAAAMRTEEFDRRHELGAPVPELVSVTQAAETLGVSRQAVLQRLESGTLPGQKVGSTWVVPASAVTRNT